MIIRKAALCMSIVALNAQALASPMNMKMFGHVVEIRKSTDGREQLSVDKKVLLNDQYISLEEIATVDGIPSVIGQRSAGGNACNGSAFILSFPASAPVKIDGPLDACNPNETRIEDKQIIVEVAPTAQTPGSQWTWSPSSGFSVEKSIAFTTKRDDGWAALRSRSINHPSAMLDYADLSQLIDLRIGKAKASFVSVSSGPGSAQYWNNLLIASSCRAHSCDDTGLLVVADIPRKQVLVALKDGASGLLIAPKEEEWPSGARGELAVFLKKWRR
jgi:hypothetical protein